MSAGIMDIFLNNNIDTSPLFVPKATPRKYVSIFRIDGVPILGPLMTEEKTLEMQTYKEQAIKLEGILSEKRRKKQQHQSQNRNVSLETVRSPLVEPQQTTRSELESSIYTNFTGDCSLSQNSVSLEESYLPLAAKELNNNEVTPPTFGEQHPFGKTFTNSSTNTYDSELIPRYGMVLKDSSTNTSPNNGEDDVSTISHQDQRAAKELESDSEAELRLLQRLKKLEKSDTIIYDNRRNTVIMPIDEKDLEQETRKLQMREAQERSPPQQQLQHQQMQGRQKMTIVQDIIAKFSAPCQPVQKHSVTELRENLERQIQISQSNNLNRKPLNLPFALQTIKPQFTSIPSICINPPTPAMPGPISICDKNLSGSESADSFQYSQAPTTMTTTIQKMDEYCSEDDDDKSLESVLSNNAGKRFSASDPQDSNMSEKVLRFEIDQNSNTEEEVNRQCQMRRSATSPSLQLLCKKPAKTNMLCASLTGEMMASNDEAGSNALVRSNSFTLDTPSKALIDHMRQKNTSGQPNGSVNKKPKRRFAESPSPSALRDTVESKAKRVQKAEIKSRTPSCASNKRNQRKNAPNSFNTIPHRASAAPVWGANNTAPFDKSKIASPYGSSKSSATASGRNTSAKRTPMPQKQKHIKKYGVKKSSSTTTYTLPNPQSSIQSPDASISSRNTYNKTSVSGSSPGMPTISPVMPTPSPVAGDMLQDIENRHRQKYLMLLAYQQEEQQRMQRTFETQHKMLMEQLSLEMNRATLSACSTSSDTSTVKGQAMGQKGLLHNEMNPVMLPSSTFVGPAITETITTTSASTFGQTITTTSMTTTAMDLRSITPPLAMPLNFVGTPTSAISPQMVCIEGADEQYQRRRLFSCADVNLIGNNSNSPIRSSDSRRDAIRGQESAEDEQSYTAAVIKVQAAIRGFLTRRLLRTEKVQRIVQTMRDTLIFVLNLHIETLNDADEANTPANIKLKARLLQQLTSASRALYLILFATTIKERMGIIARDRKRIQTKVVTVGLKKAE